MCCEHDHQIRLSSRPAWRRLSNGRRHVGGHVGAFERRSHRLTAQLGRSRHHTTPTKGRYRLSELFPPGRTWSPVRRVSIGRVPLHEITVHFEAETDEEVERLVEAVERAICPHPPDREHLCPNRWNIMRHVVDPERAAKLDDLLNR
jgi:hypothetical protein